LPVFIFRYLKLQAMPFRVLKLSTAQSETQHRIL